MEGMSPEGHAGAVDGLVFLDVCQAAPLRSARTGSGAALAAVQWICTLGEFAFGFASAGGGAVGRLVRSGMRGRCCCFGWELFRRIVGFSSCGCASGPAASFFTLTDAERTRALWCGYELQFSQWLHMESLAWLLVFTSWSGSAVQSLFSGNALVAVARVNIDRWNVVALAAIGL